MLASWQVALVKSALRAEFCEAGGRPLVGFTVGLHTQSAAGSFANLFEQFPELSETVLTRRLAAAGDRHRFRVVSVDLLHARQQAPKVVVETDRDRMDFAADVPHIWQLFEVSPTSGGRKPAYEGWFLEARDAEGPFVVAWADFRNSESGHWAWDPCALPTIGGRC